MTHWCITELGSKKGRIHIHGIFCIKENQDIKYIKDKIKREWDFGWNYLGYVDQGKTINYITKYMLKENENFNEFKPKVLASQKIGIGFIERNKRFYKYKEKNGEIEANYHYRFFIVSRKIRRHPSNFISIVFIRISSSVIPTGRI